MAATEVSDESLWQLFGASPADQSSQLILNSTQNAAEAIYRKDESSPVR